MGYDPRCCRFPKSCSATVYDAELVTEEELEPPAEGALTLIDYRTELWQRMSEQVSYGMVRGIEDLDLTAEQIGKLLEISVPVVVDTPLLSRATEDYYTHFLLPRMERIVADLNELMPPGLKVVIVPES